MVFAKVTEQQQAKLQSAQSAVASLESELNLKRDERTNTQYKQDLLRARTERDTMAKKISAGQAEFGEKDMDEAMNALVGIKKTTETYLEKLLQQRKMAKPTAGATTAPPPVVLSAAEIQQL